MTPSGPQTFRTVPPPTYRKEGFRPRFAVQVQRNEEALSMTADQPSMIFQEIYRDYLLRLSRLKWEDLASRTGLERHGERLWVPFLNQRYSVSPEGIRDSLDREPGHALKVVLCKYLLLYPDREPQEADWISYKDFPDAAPFAGGFRANSEQALARHFTGRGNELMRAGKELGGSDPKLDWNYEVRFRFEVLPKLPMLLLFNDEDDEFPAQCVLLFERRAERYLDMECLAIAGWLLADALRNASGDPRSTVM